MHVLKYKKVNIETGKIEVKRQKLEYLAGTNNLYDCELNLADDSSCAFELLIFVGKVWTFKVLFGYFYILLLSFYLEIF